MKILNLYAGIGGNRKLWGDVDVVAVEWDKDISRIYHDYFPKDEIVVGDAHEYLLKHFQEFDFIWSSPPCPTHSRMGKSNQLRKVPYPDMKLYEEILLLKHYFKGKYVVENVISFYEPLIKPITLHRHYVWANFPIVDKKFEVLQTASRPKEREFLQEKFGFDLSKYTGIDKRNVLRNAVVPEMGLHIFEEYKKAIGVSKEDIVNQPTLQF